MCWGVGCRSVRHGQISLLKFILAVCEEDTGGKAQLMLKPQPHVPGKFRVLLLSSEIPGLLAHRPPIRFFLSRFCWPRADSDTKPHRSPFPRTLPYCEHSLYQTSRVTSGPTQKTLSHGIFGLFLKPFRIHCPRPFPSRELFTVPWLLSPPLRSVVFSCPPLSQVALEPSTICLLPEEQFRPPRPLPKLTDPKSLANLTEGRRASLSAPAAWDQAEPTMRPWAPRAASLAFLSLRSMTNPRLEVHSHS